MNPNRENILQKIKAFKGKFTPQQAKIADYLLDNHAGAAFLTATQLARETGVSQPTVIRFAQLLGFSKYSMFLEAFQDLLKEELTSTDRLNLSLGRQKTVRDGHFDIIYREMRSLDLLANSFPLEEFHQLVEWIAGSDRVAVVGTRGSEALAQYLAYFLGKVKRGVCSITSGATKEYDRLLEFGSTDLMIALAFPRYPRETIELAKYARLRGVKLAAVTDKIDSPLSSAADIILVIPVTFSTIFDSYCSALCLFSMIVTEVGRANREESQTLFNDFEKLAKDVRIFFRAE